MNVQVRFDDQNSKLVIIVNDSGRGIKNEDQDAIFKILSENQSEMLSEKNQMGLDLFISKQIVMKFDGDIDFVSAPNKGSTFIFTFDMEVDDLEQ